MKSNEIIKQNRLSDIHRWNDLNFVIGYEIHRSNNCDNECEICENLVGIYPKKFIWSGWHDACKCYITPILQDREEISENTVNELRAALNGFYYNEPEPKMLIKVLSKNFLLWYFRNVELMLADNIFPDFVKNNIDLIKESIEYYKSNR